MDQAKQAMREATPQEWAASLWNDAQPMTEARLALVISAAIERGRRHERNACHRLAVEHALTITEETVAKTPFGGRLGEQDRIDYASDLRHVAQYVGAMIFKRFAKRRPDGSASSPSRSCEGNTGQMRYSDHEQRQMDIKSGEELDRHAERKASKQTDIRSASFRVVDDTPGHATYGVWVNGGKCGDLTVRQEERVAFEIMMERAGFQKRALREEPPSPKEGILRMQPSHRWAVCRPGRDPVEITSGEPLRIWMGHRFVLTHIEHASGRGYYSVDGYQLVDGMRAAYGSEG